MVSRADIRQNKGKEHYSVAATKGEFDTVFKHEAKIFFSHMFLVLNLTLGAIAPAILYLGFYMLPTLNGGSPIVSFSLPVIIIGLMLPRIPMNMAAISVVGEKVYKTGESLISTSIDIRKAFYAKCAFPIVLGFISTIISAVLTLVTANILNFTHDGTGILLFESYEWILIFLTSFFVEIIMIGITCYFSFKMKVPRNGTIVSSLLSFAPAGVYAVACYMLPESYKLLFVVGITIVFGVFSFVIYRAMFSKLTHSTVMGLL
ncbi:hypothetical protein FACS189499_04620 [Clostridia bacterium]|nr:hypothetical protein FACS189499_04620 [Clostridia bacterium]